MYSSQERVHIAQARRNPTIKRYTDSSKESLEDTQAMDIDLTKHLTVYENEQANSGADFFDEESNFDDYAYETSGSSFSSTASLVDQLGGTFDEPELLVTPTPSASPPPSAPVILAKAPKPVGVFSIADFMKNVQAPSAAVPRASPAPPLPPLPEDLSQKRNSAYSQSSKEPMTSIDPHEEENTWEDENNANNFNDDVENDASSGFPPLDSNSDNSVLSDLPDYDQNYDRSFEEEEKYIEEQVKEREHPSMGETKYDQRAVASSPAPSVASSAAPSVFSQVNPLFSRPTRDDGSSLQQQATEIDQISNGQKYNVDYANNNVRSQGSQVAVELAQAPVSAPTVASAAELVPAPAPAPAPTPTPTPRFTVTDRFAGSAVSVAPAVSAAEPVELVGDNEVDTEDPPPPPLQTKTYTTVVVLENVEYETTASTAPIEKQEHVKMESKVAPSYADEYSTLGSYSHFFHTPLSPPMEAMPEKSVLPVVLPSVAVVVTPSNKVNIEEHAVNAIESTPVTGIRTYSVDADRNKIINADHNGHSVASVENSSPTAKTIEGPDLALTTTSSRYRGRFLSPDKVHACLLAATATPAMSSPVPDSGRVDKNRNKKQVTSGGVPDNVKINATTEKITSLVDTSSSAISLVAAAGSELSSSSVKPSSDNVYLNTTDTAHSLYCNYEVHSFSASIRAFSDSELLLQYKTSLLLQSQLIDKILHQRRTLQDSQDPDQQLRMQMTMDITTEMLQKSMLESSVLSSAVFSAQPSLNSTVNNTQESTATYTQESNSTYPAPKASVHSSSRSAATSRTLLHKDSESVPPPPPPLKHHTYGPHAVTATPPRTSHSTVRGSANLITQSSRSATPTAQAGRKIRSSTPNMRTTQPKATTAPPQSPRTSSQSEQVSSPGAPRSDALRRTPSGTIIPSPLTGVSMRANSVNKASMLRNTAKAELSRVNNTHSGGKPAKFTPTPADLVLTPIKSADNSVEIVASTMNSSIQLFSATPLSHDSFRRNASLVNSMLGNIDNYCNCCRTKLIDMDAQKNTKLKHSQCRNCLHSK